ncbi:MAG: SDR family oxidoreductase [Hoeflea sp.]|uniref:SDR family NAD(P)-dependent oxidoreductase n=1 Tax=Hoeflea sp. TaxID=1940281 RepID=UPI001DD3435E|nr:SDR family oxidoreductase [Hoeflea sp.]MBU4531338.1 SDR family oxidoreductase [Alphaproteobacteria bacterium]MBU4544195.1 SDR family oxidoreductase [Alphaproteobacteria bacterium]MBU4550568.1 SDR family oxidoreductase [Alphaproteobacteria bacterium]MBV1724614.1 SDR family oxidoreductase [Hoeflea sp.]MBV1760634.1 SDR family oxidoreductase [Hoeflea sp.]
MRGTDMFNLKGRVALVTGASSGLGRAAATFLAQAGARVVGLARRADALDQWCAEAGGETAYVAADLASDADLETIAAQAAEPFGPPDILVNAAGLNLRQSADDVTRDGWERTIALNLTVPFFLAQALVPAMREKRWGRIINFASLQSRRAFTNGIAYGASKGGVEQMTRAMAEAWSRDGINANALAPGFFHTELTGPVFADPTVSGRHAAATCIGRNGEMGDIEGPLLFLASDASAYVTGQVLFVDGGYTAK